MICYICGHEIPDDSVICPYCKERFNDKDKVQPVDSSSEVAKETKTKKKEREPLINKLKNKLGMKGFILVLIVIVLIVAAVITVFVVKATTKHTVYKSAIELMENENYSEAMVVFTELGDYLDSVELAETCDKNLLYESAIKDMSNKDYATAQKKFDQLDGFLDSNIKSNECANEIRYIYADSQFEAENYEEAYNYFLELDNYKDSSQKTKVCKYHIDYNLALEYMDKAEYSKAESILSNIADGYFDDKEQLIYTCKKMPAYTKALARYEEGHYYSAYLLFNELGEFKDSAELAKKCIRDYPETGETYRNPEYSEEDCVLIINPPLDGTCNFLKLYADDVLVVSIFINAGDSYTVKIPANDYTIKAAYSNEKWFGEDMFGDNAIYERISYLENQVEFELRSGYVYTLNLRTDVDAENQKIVSGGNETRTSF